MLKFEQLYQLHLRLCELKQNERVFGGVSLIIFNDLMQLKPIRGSYIFQQPKHCQFNQVHEIFPLWDLFQCVDLVENHRQGEDCQYAELLNGLHFKEKKEELSKEDLSLLNDRVKNPVNEESTIRIYGTNETVNRKNTEKLCHLETSLLTAEAIHIPSRRNVKIKPS